MNGEDDAPVAENVGGISAHRPGAPVLVMRRISKTFGGVRALIDVDLEANVRAVHAIVGENGAGKSTLMKVISGVYAVDEGEILFDGEPTAIRSPHQASALGIRTVYQEPPLYPDMSVLENFQVGQEPRNRFGGIDWKIGRARAREALALVQLPARVLNQPMRSLSIGLQQLVLIARAVAAGPKLLILDEPTSMLSRAETGTLFGLVRGLRDEGAAVLYISHRLEEIFEVSNELTVLRDGQVRGHLQTSEATEAQIVELMSGRTIEQRLYTPRTTKADKPALEVRNLTSEGVYEDVTFNVFPGEIVGFYGLVGSGRSEVARTIFGAEPATSGEVVLERKRIRPNSPRKAIKLGVAYLAEDRRTQGLFLIRPVSDNLTAAVLFRFRRWLVNLNSRAESALARNSIRDLSIRTPSEHTPIDNLSGGSQQKVMFARWLLARPKVLILDEPTRGIDVGTKAQIHQLIVQLAREDGTPVMLISSELPEVLGISDRVVVMREGRITADLIRAEATEQAVLRAALGIGVEVA
jgi:ABC-type sugar transport system ATPase subunit